MMRLWRSDPTLTLKVSCRRESRGAWLSIINNLKDARTQGWEFFIGIGGHNETAWILSYRLVSVHYHTLIQNWERAGI